MFILIIILYRSILIAIKINNKNLYAFTDNYIIKPNYLFFLYFLNNNFCHENTIGSFEGRSLSREYSAVAAITILVLTFGALGFIGMIPSFLGSVSIIYLLHWSSSSQSEQQYRRQGLTLAGSRAIRRPAIFLEEGMPNIVAASRISLGSSSLKNSFRYWVILPAERSA